jgi:hypothetical protein
MNPIATLYRQVQHLGPRTTTERAFGLGCRHIAHAVGQARDAVFSSYVGYDELRKWRMVKLRRFLPSLTIPDDFPVEQFHALAQQYVLHRFDLLGSGWADVRHGAICRGMGGYRYSSGPSISADVAGAWLLPRINRANQPMSLAAWQLVQQPYTPIDWQLDFKSGYRWSEKTWHGRVPYGHLPGVDIKVPWELARMQHLPQMALAYAAARQSRNTPVWAARLAREFRNQILDFIAANPPRFGVNWRCAMDVGIRAANWALAFDLFQAAGWNPDPAFESQLAASLVAHGRFIWQNLEWRRMHRGNHYLANLAGLFFIAAYLPRSRETDTWLLFSQRELAAETTLQFTPDGANFEASTCYHRLSAEMVLYCAAWSRALPSQHLNTANVPLDGNQLGKMAEFTRDLTKPNGEIHQIGDNDSGRFFKLHPAIRGVPFDHAPPHCGNLSHSQPAERHVSGLEENHLDHRSLVAAIGTLLGRKELLDFAGDYWADALVLRHLLSNQARTLDWKPPSVNSAILTSQVTGKVHQLADDLSTQPTLVRHQFAIRLPQNILQQPLTTIAYRDFGVYAWRNDRMYLAVRCGPIGQNENGGHAHNDQLAIELQVDGEDWLVDPGTFIYTALPRERNEYRSARAHFVPLLIDHREPGRLDVGLFQLGNNALAKTLAFGPSGFLGMHVGYGLPVYRAVLWQQGQVIVRDFSDRSQPLAPVNDIEHRPTLARLQISTGYGIQRAA